MDALVQEVGTAPPRSGLGPREDAVAGEQVSDEAVAHRKAIVVRAGADVVFNASGPNPKQAFRVVLCKLMEDQANAEALAYIPVGLGFRSKGDTFGKSALSRIFCQFGHCLPEETKQQIFDEVTTYDGWLTGGTENHIAMRRTAGFLFGEAFPEAQFQHGLKGSELAEVCLLYMRAYGRALFRNSMVEFLSPIYHAVHTSAWLNIYEFAKDPNAKQCARAILDWMFADLAANSHHSIIIPPAARAKGIVTDSYQLSTVRSNTQWTAWLYWGAGNIESSLKAVAGTDTWEKSPLSLHSVSNYVPELVVRNLGAKRIATPYSLLQARANREVMEPPSLNAFGKKAPVHHNQPNRAYCTRSVYVNRNYAIGAGARVADIEEGTIRHAHAFGVIWRDTAPRNWMFFVHPYWYPTRPHEETGEPLGVDDWAGTSPFLQMVHWENSAVLLLDLPDRDPYFGKARGTNPKWISDRAERPFHCLNAYIPETVEEVKENEDGFFLRAGDVFIGIRGIGGKNGWGQSKQKGYRKLVIEGDAIGAAVEVGDQVEYGSLERFRERVAAADLDLSNLTTRKQVRYTSTRGHELDIRHNAEDWRPIASVNGAHLDFDKWPTCESPYLSCRDGIMNVNDGKSGFTVDWHGDWPEYTYYDVE
jgi:hypothetical protein